MELRKNWWSSVPSNADPRYDLADRKGPLRVEGLADVVLVEGPVFVEATLAHGQGRRS